MKNKYIDLIDQTYYFPQDEFTLEGDELRFEANLFDFAEEIYGDTIRIIWLDKIRDMVKFDGIEELVAQLKSDEEVARNWECSE